MCSIRGIKFVFGIAHRLTASNRTQHKKYTNVLVLIFLTFETQTITETWETAFYMCEICITSHNRLLFV